MDRWERRVARRGRGRGARWGGGSTTHMRRSRRCGPSHRGPCGVGEGLLRRPGRGAAAPDTHGRRRPCITRFATKPYPVSGIAQVPTSLAVAAGRSVDTYARPQRMLLRMAPSELAYPGTDNRGPFNSRSDSLMSVVRCVAVGYRHGHIPYRSLARAPSVQETELLEMVELVGDERLAETEAVLEIETDNGSRRRFHGQRPRAALSTCRRGVRRPCVGGCTIGGRPGCRHRARRDGASPIRSRRDRAGRLRRSRAKGGLTMSGERQSTSGFETPIFASGASIEARQLEERYAYPPPGTFPFTRGFSEPRIPRPGLGLGDVRRVRFR